MSNYLFNDAKVYCGTYGKYNNGDLSGEWISLDDFGDFEEFCKYIEELHKEEEDPEYMFQDSENMHVDGEPDLHDIEQWYKLFKYRTYDIEEDLASAMVEYGICEWKDVEEYYNEYFFSSYDDVSQFGYEMAEESISHDILDTLSGYFDFERYGEDIASDFTQIEVDGTTYLFD